jgi:hypothetical protein
MAEYVLTDAYNGDVSFIVYADTVSLLPTRVEIQGVSGRYRFFVSSADKTRSWKTTFDSPTVISRTITNAVASRYDPSWVIGIEGI